MIMRKLSIITLAAVLVSLCLVSTASAQDTLLINYQGYLTDNGGDPVTGTTSMTFTIYDAGGVSKWTESHPTVQVNGGLFNVILGSRSALPDSVLNGQDRYLGISIESDDEIIPRTPLIFSPGAAFSRRVVSADVDVGDGKLELGGKIGGKGNILIQVNADSAIGVFGNAEPFDMAGDLEIGANADEAGLLMTYGAADDPPDMELSVMADINTIRLNPPGPCTPPDPCNPAVEIAATTEHHSMTINKPSPDDNRPAIKLTANNENKIDLYYPDAESDEGIVQIGANAAEGAFIELHAADSLTVTRIMMGGSTADTGFVRLFSGDKDLEFKVLELNSHSNTGGNVKIFDPENIDGREMLRIGSSPNAAGGADRELMAGKNRLADGIGIYGFNPQPEPPGHIAFELTSEASQGGRLAVYDTEDASAELAASESLVGMSLLKGNSLTKLGINSHPSLSMVNNLEGGDSISIEMSVNATSADLSVKKHEAAFGDKWAITHINDTQSVHIDLGVASSDAGTHIARLSTKPDQTQLILSKDFVGVGEPDSGAVIANITTDETELTLYRGSTVDPQAIVLQLDDIGGRIGINTSEPSEELYVVGDITATGAITELSSIKYKANINQMSDALEKVKDLRGVNFNWRAADYPEMKFPESQQVGLIAEEVAKIVPQLVHSGDNGELSVDYSKLTAVLIEAIKEQQQQIEVLSKRVEELENIKTSN